ncbi:hypothetical protein EL17_16275 [Anditalea andensis]|uniref:Uncharacterized protein n=1 Tax=Anditalea andensis TaxID=1048983 RepID=A0A074KQS8_9BACT|nr:hypothetical protein EL17_16275 [Anditalea andensis]
MYYIIKLMYMINIILIFKIIFYHDGLAPNFLINKFLLSLHVNRSHDLIIQSGFKKGTVYMG